jgi:hypothetical protein
MDVSTENLMLSKFLAVALAASLYLHAEIRTALSPAESDAFGRNTLQLP